ncbi:MAG: N-acetylmuramoyl-L-alanine amidase, partial [Acidobacteriota bacterium]
RHAHLLLWLAVLAAAPGGAVTITTPGGNSELFARGELVDLVGLLRLAGAQVQFAPAAGSFTAVAGGHEVQFTPGGSLAVVDGRLTPLPGPARALEGHVVGSRATANALLGPLGWNLGGTGEAPVLAPVTGAERLSVELLRTATGSMIVISGARERPRVVPSRAAVSLQFPNAVELAQPVTPEGGVLAAETHERSLTFRLAEGVEMTSSYPLENPARFVVLLGAAAPEAPGVAERKGPLLVLDPGHGGEDEGARGPAGELEKDIALAVARLTAAQLQAAGVAVRLTRETDQAVALVDRTALANRLRADAFVSIHLNASPARGARGAETYFMSADATDPLAAQAAARENASAPPDTVQLILWDLAHVANLNASASLARSIQERLNAEHGITDRGIKQAPFVVLTGATMPAALVEVGFLSNPEEAARLLSPAGQNEMAGALAAGALDFLRNQSAASSTPEPIP